MPQKTIAQRDDLERAPWPVFRAGQDGALLNASAALARLLGYPDAASLRAVGVRRLLPSGRYADLWATWGAAAEGAAQDIADLQRADGSLVRVRLDGWMERDADGAAVALGAMVKPVHARPAPPSGYEARREDAVSAVQRQLHQDVEWSRFLTAAADQAELGLAISVLGHEGSPRLAFINEGGARILGRPVRDLLGGPPVPALRPEDEAMLRAKAWRMVPGAKPLTLLTEVARGDGSSAAVEVGLSAGAYWGQPATFTFFRDVTERQRALEERERDASLLRATLDSTTDGILVVDAQGRITAHNAAFARMWRIPEDILAAGEDARALTHVLDQLREPDAFLRKVRELYADPEASSFDVLEFKDGRVFERSSQPQRVAGRSVGRVWSFRDVTRQRAAERARIAGAAQAAELQRLRAVDAFKTRFLNAAAHELGTPLTPIRVQLHLLRDPNGPHRTEEGRRKALAVLDRNFERLSRLVNDLLEAARLQRGAHHVDARPVDLGALVAEAAESFEAVARQAGVRLEVHARPAPIEADATHLSQVLVNLLSNAVKFSHRGGTVTVDVERRGGRASVRVRDEGLGLTAEQRAQLFQPFTKLHEERNPSGTGLGLYISKTIVELHGGRLWCESAGPGRGATFAFEVPARPAARLAAKP